MNFSHLRDVLLKKYDGIRALQGPVSGGSLHCKSTNLNHVLIKSVGTDLLWHVLWQLNLLIKLLSFPRQPP